MEKKEEVEKEETQFKKYKICFYLKIPRNQTEKVIKSIEEELYKMYEENGIKVSYVRGEI